MKILSSFTHPQVVHKPVWMSLFCWTQRKIFWRMWETEQFWGTIDFHSIFFSYNGSQRCPKTTLLQTFFKISSSVFGRTKKCIQVWNYMRVSKWWQHFNFWVNYPFNIPAIMVSARSMRWSTSWMRPISVQASRFRKLFFSTAVNILHTSAWQVESHLSSISTMQMMLSVSWMIKFISRSNCPPTSCTDTIKVSHKWSQSQKKYNKNLENEYQSEAKCKQNPAAKEKSHRIQQKQFI